MTTWRNAPDASGLWWVRREGQPDDVLRVDIDADGVWINRGGEGWCSTAEYDGARWSRVVTPDTHAEIVRERDHYRERAAEHHRRGDEARHEAATLRRRVEALESALREVCETHRASGGWCMHCLELWDGKHRSECHIGRALAVLRGAP